jgi:predicted HAD superfamily Cof-like phosphohydrolase
VTPRVSEAATLVREFHEAFGGQIFERTAAVRELRARLTREEAREASDAILSGDLEATAKELADQVVVAYGTALSLGIDLDAAVRVVHASNMSKLVDGVLMMRSDGKVLKGPNYRKPDMSHCVLDEERIGQ